MARGDQIYVMREFLNTEGMYEHHGIDCGDGTVIHYRKGDEAVISRTSLTAFARNQPIQVRCYTVASVPDVVIRRAESRLGEKKYNLLFNNCEHFATWCKTGISDSRQVREFVPLLGNFNVRELDAPIADALQQEDMTRSPQFLQDALGKIKVVWDDLQPRHNQAVREAKSWERVALHSLQIGREDLARVALYRKRTFQQEAERLRHHLDQLATMTKNLTCKLPNQSIL